MKVHELIKKLQALPDQNQIVVMGTDWDESKDYPVLTVESIHSVSYYPSMVVIVPERSE